MPGVVVCPNCDHPFRSELHRNEGGKVLCPQCQVIFLPQEGTASADHAIQEPRSRSGSGVRDDEQITFHKTPSVAEPAPAPLASSSAPPRRSLMPFIVLGLLILFGMVAYSAYRELRSPPGPEKIDPKLSPLVTFLPQNADFVLGVEYQAIPATEQRGPVWEGFIHRLVRGGSTFAPEAWRLVGGTRRFLMAQGTGLQGSEKLLLFESAQPYQSADIFESLQLPVPAAISRPGRQFLNEEQTTSLALIDARLYLLGELPEITWRALLERRPDQFLLPRPIEAMLQKVRGNFLWALWPRQEEADLPEFLLDGPELEDFPGPLERIQGFFLAVHPRRRDARALLGILCADENDARALLPGIRELWRKRGRGLIQDLIQQRRLEEEFKLRPDGVIAEIHRGLQFRQEGPFILAALTLSERPLTEAEKVLLALMQE